MLLLVPSSSARAVGRRLEVTCKIAGFVAILVDLALFASYRCGEACRQTEEAGIMLTVVSTRGFWAACEAAGGPRAVSHGLVVVCWCLAASWRSPRGLVPVLVLVLVVVVVPVVVVVAVVAVVVDGVVAVVVVVVVVAVVAVVGGGVDGRPHPGTENQPGAAVRTTARRKRRQTYPELDRAGGAAWSCLGLMLAAAGTPKPPPSSACSREPAPLPRLLRSARLHRQPGCCGGTASLLLLRSGRLQPRSSSCRCMQSPVLPDQPRTCTSSSPTLVGPAGLSRAVSRAVRIMVE